MDSKDNTRSNVIPIRRDGPIFSQHLRKRIEESVAPQTEKPAEVVNTMEQVICSQIVQFARDLAVRIATRAGKRAGDLMENLK